MIVVFVRSVGCWMIVGPMPNHPAWLARNQNRTASKMTNPTIMAIVAAVQPAAAEALSSR
jgi:hypothetical protein